MSPVVRLRAWGSKIALLLLSGQKCMPLFRKVRKKSQRVCSYHHVTPRFGKKCTEYVATFPRHGDRIKSRSHTQEKRVAACLGSKTF